MVKTDDYLELMEIMKTLPENEINDVLYNGTVIQRTAALKFTDLDKVVDALHDSDPTVRANAINVIRESDDLTFIAKNGEEFGFLVEDPSPAVKKELLNLIDNMGGRMYLSGPCAAMPLPNTERCHYVFRDIVDYLKSDEDEVVRGMAEDIQTEKEFYRKPKDMGLDR